MQHKLTDDQKKEWIAAWEAGTYALREILEQAFIPTTLAPKLKTAQHFLGYLLQLLDNEKGTKNATEESSKKD